MSTTLYAYLGNTPITFGAYGSNTTTIASTWTRPSDWLTMPDTSSMTGSVGSFVGLLAVPTGSGNFVALSATNAYTVTWGDGTSGSYAANATAQYQYNYDTLPSSSYSSGSVPNNGGLGYRQVLITVVPSGSGVNFTGINLQKKHSQGGLPAVPDVNWLDIAVGGSNITSINNIGGVAVNLQYLAQCNVVNISSSITNFSNMFSNCYSLQSVPLFNTQNGTNFSNMFYSSYTAMALNTVPLFNTSNGTSFSSMFNGCVALNTVPLFDTRNGTDFGYMFYYCYSLQSVPLFNTQNGTNFSYMFTSCFSLPSVPLFNTQNGINFGGMFDTCYSLHSVPLFNTQNGTNFSDMFNKCRSLASIPPFNVTNTAATASGTFTTMFNQQCYNLQIGTLSGSRSTIDYTGCILSYPEIINIFNNLGITGSVPCSITCSGNWGSSSLSPSDISIATNKGWTVKN